MSATFIEYQGRQIIQIDLSNSLSLEDSKEIINKAYRIIKLQRNEELLILYIFGNFKFSKEFVKFFIPKMLELKHKVKIRAYCINTDEQEKFLRLFKGTMKILHNTKFFRNQAMAMNWLIEEGKDKTEGVNNASMGKSSQ